MSRKIIYHLSAFDVLPKYNMENFFDNMYGVDCNPNRSALPELEIHIHYINPVQYSFHLSSLTYNFLYP